MNYNIKVPNTRNHTTTKASQLTQSINTSHSSYSHSHTDSRSHSSHFSLKDFAHAEEKLIQNLQHQDEKKRKKKLTLIQQKGGQSIVKNANTDLTRGRYVFRNELKSVFSQKLNIAKQKHFLESPVGMENRHAWKPRIKSGVPKQLPFDIEDIEKHGQ
jgi:hypothetical protein